MHIHLCDAGSDRGQYDLLAQEQYQSHLCSYAYADGPLVSYENTWKKMVQIYLAGHPSQKKEIQYASMGPIENHLTTYADPLEVKNKEKVIQRQIAENSLGEGVLPRVIIDSGAFSAFASNRIVHPQEYAQWAIQFDAKWRSHLKSLLFMNLDVIGDQDATWKNQKLLEKLGMNPMPIVTHGVDLSHLDRALEGYDYIALGGLVPHTRQRKKLEAWLDPCFSRVMAYFKKTKKLRKVHLLGITSEWVLQRYPLYSCDSSSWTSCLRFGGGTASGIKHLPRYKESDGALAANIHNLRSEVKKFQKMQIDSTNLWKSRGITWDD
jgi:hypothetical protein